MNERAADLIRKFHEAADVSASNLKKLLRTAYEAAGSSEENMPVREAIIAVADALHIELAN